MLFIYIHFNFFSKVVIVVCLTLILFIAGVPPGQDAKALPSQEAKAPPSQDAEISPSQQAEGLPPTS